MSKINIDRIVKDIKTRSTILTPIIEAVCNSIDAINPNRTDGIIDIVIKRSGQLSLELESSKTQSEIVAIDIIDNGEGFTEANRESFDTFRSGLKSQKGGKGFGRFMYLKYFNHVTVESIYKFENEYLKRSFTFGHSDEIIEDEVIERIEPSENTKTGTVLHLSSIKTHDIDKGIDVIARKLVERLLVFFATSDDHMPRICIKEEDNSNSIVLNDYVGNNSDIVQVGETKTIKIQGKTSTYDFFVKVYKIYYSAITNKICLTANKREVTESPLHTFVPEFKETMSEIIDGKAQKNYMIKVYVQGNYLDDNVTTERDAFNFSKDEDSFFDLSERSIYTHAAKIAETFFKDAIQERFNAKKKSIEHYVYSQAPWNKILLDELQLDNIPVDISDFEKEMLFQKMKFEKEQKARIAINEIISNSENDELPSENELEADIQEILKIVTEGQKNDLAHYVCQRKKIIELYDELRKRMDNGKPHKESELHNLFFPMINTDRQTEYESNNLWLIDERFNFTQYIASDKVISKVDHKEPDLALFFEEGKFFRNGDNVITSPIAIVEFKRPKRTNYPADENPIQQALEYAEKILQGKYEMPEGLEEVIIDRKNTPVYVYIICDIVDKIRRFASYAQLSPTPDGQGYIGYNRDLNAYIEIKSFKKVIDDAKMRNQIFFHKLGLS